MAYFSPRTRWTRREVVISHNRRRSHVARLPTTVRQRKENRRATREARAILAALALRARARLGVRR